MGAQLDNTKEGIDTFIQSGILGLGNQVGLVSGETVAQESPWVQQAETVAANVQQTGNGNPTAVAGGTLLADQIGLKSVFEGFTDESVVTGQDFNRGWMERASSISLGVSQFSGTVAGGTRGVAGPSRALIRKSTTSSLVDETAGASNYLRRPYIRQDVRSTVEQRTLQTSEERFIDPRGVPIDSKYDLGHKPGYEFWRMKRDAERQGLTQSQFRAVNDLFACSRIP
jgi:hypothetical protein